MDEVAEQLKRWPRDNYVDNFHLDKLATYLVFAHPTLCVVAAICLGTRSGWYLLLAVPAVLSLGFHRRARWAFNAGMALYAAAIVSMAVLAMLSVMSWSTAGAALFPGTVYLLLIRHVRDASDRQRPS
jgi:uncharacterized membrane protein YhhN